MAIDELGAVMLIEVSVAVVTVSAKVFEVTPLNEAVMFELPTATPVARPVVEMVAAAVLEEFQVTVLVMLAVELSL